MARQKPRPQRPTTRAGRLDASRAAVAEGRSRKAHSSRTVDSAAGKGSTITEDLLDLTLERVELGAPHKLKVYRHFVGRTCGCLFTLVDVLCRFLYTRHVGARTAAGVTKKVQLRAGKPDLSKQNALLIRTIFDGNGNMTHERACVMSLFNISASRYTRLHNLAKMEHKITVVSRKSIRKDDMARIVIPASAFNPPGVLQWFSQLKDDDPVEVRRARGHALIGRASNHAMPQAVVLEFHRFVAASSHPNGRREGSGHPEYYFDPGFTTIEDSKAANSRDNAVVDGLPTSLVSGFNAFLRMQSAGSSVSGSTFRRWLNMFYPRHGLHPHNSDYCDVCCELHKRLREREGTLMRYRRLPSSCQDVVAEAQRDLEAVQERIRAHKQEAAAERAAYHASIRRVQCEQRAMIRAGQDIDLLQAAVAKCMPLIAIDYMQEQTLPYFGRSAQPGSTYYLQKETIHLFGAVCIQYTERADFEYQHPGGNSVFLTSEREDGAKSSDHLLSYLLLILNQLPIGCRRLQLCGDNAATIKSRYLLAWAMETVQSGVLDDIILTFMLPGHTKFAPDRLFSRLSAAFRPNDLFEIRDITRLAKPFATDTREVTVEELRSWRDAIDTKYGDVKGVRALRWFRVHRTVQGDAVLDVSASAASSAVSNAVRREFVKLSQKGAIVTPARKSARGLDRKKLADLLLMYDRFIPNERCPQYLRVRQTTQPANEGDAALRVVSEYPRTVASTHSIATPDLHSIES